MKTNNKKGFTLIELLIVVAIIGIIAAIAIPNLLDAMNRSKFKRTEADMRAWGTGVEQYKVDHFGNAPFVAAGDLAALGVLLGQGGLNYMQQQSAADGWGAVFFWEPGGASFANPGVPNYGFWSGGSDRTVTAGISVATTGLTFDGAAIGTRDHKTWTCDIFFANGNYLLGDCGAP